MKVTFKSGQAATYILQDTNGGALQNLQGYVTGTVNTQYFLHIFDYIGASISFPANGTTPKKSLQVLGQDGFSFTFSPDDLEFVAAGIVFALSSTEATYTAVVDGAKVDWEGEYDTQAVQGLSTAGDITTGRASLQVWTNASGPKVLFEVDWGNNNVAQEFLLFFTKDSPINGDTADLVIGAMDGTSKTSQFYRFGKSGLYRLGQSLTKGCTLAISSTAPTLTTVSAADTLRARFKANV